MSILKNQRGMAMVLEIILIAGVIAALAAVSYRFYTARQKSKSSKAPATQTKKVDPYAGWKTYTSTAETLSFKYPPGWRLVKDLQDRDNDGRTYEKATFAGPNNFQFKFVLQYLDGIGGGCDDCSIFEVDPLTIPGYTGGDRTSIVIQGKTTGQMANAIGLNGDSGHFTTVVGQGGSFYFTTSKLGDPYRLLFVGMYNANGQDAQFFPYASFKTKQEVKDAKLLLQSIKY